MQNGWIVHCALQHLLNMLQVGSPSHLVSVHLGRIEDKIFAKAGLARFFQLQRVCLAYCLSSRQIAPFINTDKYIQYNIICLLGFLGLRGFLGLSITGVTRSLATEAHKEALAEAGGPPNETLGDGGYLGMFFGVMCF